MDIVDLPFDDYIVKPVDREVLLDFTEALVLRSKYDHVSQRSLALASKIAVLEQSQPREELENHNEYQRLKQELQEFSAKADSTIESMVDQNVIGNAYLDI